MSAQPAEVDVKDPNVHHVLQDGRVCHNFFKVDGEWVCACGEVRNKTTGFW